MAVAALPIHKRRQAVYGKSASRSRYGAYIGDGEGQEEDTREQAHVAVRPSTSTAQQTSLASAHGKLSAKPSAKPIDLFDVPSSEDEKHIATKLVFPTGFRRKRALLEDSHSTDIHLAPWEHEQETLQHVKSSPSRKKQKEEDPAGAQIRGELEREASQAGRNRTIRLSSEPERSTKHRLLGNTVPCNAPGARSNSAAARLAAHRRKVVGNAQAVVPEQVGTPHPTNGFADMDRSLAPQKHSRKANTNHISSRPANTNLGRLTVSGTAHKIHGDIFDTPDSSGDEVSSSRPMILSRQSIKLSSEKGNGKSLLFNGSARRRLVESTASADSDTPDAPTRSPSVLDSDTVPLPEPATPPPQQSDSVRTTTSTKMTPKQATLWSRLLPGNHMQSPSNLSLRDMSISEQPSKSAPSTQPVGFQSTSMSTKHRLRLVDRLKASASCTEESADEDTELTLVADREHSHKSPSDALVDAPQKSQSIQSASQDTASSRNRAGPQITYSKTRTFLPEDSLEDDLMLGLLTDPLPKSTSQLTTNNASTKPAPQFDLPDSDDEGTGRLRTIHELRAAGRNMRTMEDIEGLLRDIGNHAASNKSRRRSALIELATKLVNKPFVERFTTHSFELQTFHECKAGPDIIADFALATVFLLLLTAGLSDHSVRTMKDNSAFEWLAKLANMNVAIASIARDRTSNLSRAQQASLRELEDAISLQTSLWKNYGKPNITPRLVGLSCMESLANRLRRLGDKTKLLEPMHCSIILAEQTRDGNDDAYETFISVSLLECLSITPLAIQWPPELLQRIASLVSGLDPATTAKRDLLFIAMRLCLNVTNSDTQNCDEVASPQLMLYLLNLIRDKFDTLANGVDEEGRTVALDILVIALGVMINLAEHSAHARQHATAAQDLLARLVNIFENGHKRMQEAESVEESVTNVAFGYLAILLANLCLNERTKIIIASTLPGKRLDMLVEAVQEFVAHHRRVDRMNFDGEEGADVWATFTEKLEAVLHRLRITASSI